MASEFEVSITLRTNIPKPKDAPEFNGLDAINLAMEQGGLIGLLKAGEYNLMGTSVEMLVVEDDYEDDDEETDEDN